MLDCLRQRSSKRRLDRIPLGTSWSNVEIKFPISIGDLIQFSLNLFHQPNRTRRSVAKALPKAINCESWFGLFFHPVKHDCEHRLRDPFLTHFPSQAHFVRCSNGNLLYRTRKFQPLGVNGYSTLTCVGIESYTHCRQVAFGKAHFVRCLQ